MRRDNDLFTAENLRRGLDAFDYESMSGQPVGWCISYVAGLPPPRVSAALYKLSALDLFEAPDETVRRLACATSDTWDYLISTSDIEDMAVAVTVIAGAYTPSGNGPCSALALSMLSGQALLRRVTTDEFMAGLEDLTLVEKRREDARKGARVRDDRLYAALRLWCQSCADKVIAEFTGRGQTLSKAELGRQVWNSFWALDPDDPRYAVLFRDHARLVRYRTVYNWVRSKVPGQKRPARTPPRRHQEACRKFELTRSGELKL